MIEFSRRPRKHSRIEILPMIDVMMFLLVFFVLISLNVIPATGLKTVLPRAATPDRIVEQKPAIVTVTADGTVQLNGDQTAISELRAKLVALKSADKPLRLIINGDSDAHLQVLIAVMDAAKNAGLDSLSIAARPK